MTDIIQANQVRDEAVVPGRVSDEQHQNLSNSVHDMWKDNHINSVGEDAKKIDGDISGIFKKLGEGKGSIQLPNCEFGESEYKPGVKFPIPGTLINGNELAPHPMPPGFFGDPGFSHPPFEPVHRPGDIGDPGFSHAPFQRRPQPGDPIPM
jgi:hypothetical protein